MSWTDPTAEPTVPLSEMEPEQSFKIVSELTGAKLPGFMSDLEASITTLGGSPDEVFAAYCIVCELFGQVAMSYYAACLNMDVLSEAEAGKFWEKRALAMIAVYRKVADELEGTDPISFVKEEQEDNQ